jgi:hypothetical protein
MKGNITARRPYNGNNSQQCYVHQDSIKKFIPHLVWYLDCICMPYPSLPLSRTRSNANSSCEKQYPNRFKSKNQRVDPLRWPSKVHVSRVNSTRCPKAPIFYRRCYVQKECIMREWRSVSCSKATITLSGWRSQAHHNHLRRTPLRQHLRNFRRHVKQPYVFLW